MDPKAETGSSGISEKKEKRVKKEKKDKKDRKSKKDKKDKKDKKEKKATASVTVVLDHKPDLSPKEKASQSNAPGTSSSGSEPVTATVVPSVQPGNANNSSPISSLPPQTKAESTSGESNTTAADATSKTLPTKSLISKFETQVQPSPAPTLPRDQRSATVAAARARFFTTTAASSIPATSPPPVQIKEAPASTSQSVDTESVMRVSDFKKRFSVQLDSAHKPPSPMENMSPKIFTKQTSGPARPLTSSPSSTTVRSFNSLRQTSDPEPTAVPESKEAVKVTAALPPKPAAAEPPRKISPEASPKQPSENSVKPAAQTPPVADAPPAKPVPELPQKSISDAPPAKPVPKLPPAKQAPETPEKSTAQSPSTLAPELPAKTMQPSASAPAQLLPSKVEKREERLPPIEINGAEPKIDNNDATPSINIQPAEPTTKISEPAAQPAISISVSPASASPATNSQPAASAPAPLVNLTKSRPAMQGRRLPKALKEKTEHHEAKLAEVKPDVVEEPAAAPIVDVLSQYLASESERRKKQAQEQQKEQRGGFGLQGAAPMSLLMGKIGMEAINKRRTISISNPVNPYRLAQQEAAAKEKPLPVLPPKPSSLSQSGGAPAGSQVAPSAAKPPLPTQSAASKSGLDVPQSAMMRRVSDDQRAKRGSWAPGSFNKDAIEMEMERQQKEEQAVRNREIFLSTLQVQRNAPHVNRLIHCKGKNRVQVRQVEVSLKSLNKGDSFVLDKGDIIYMWNGPQSNFKEKHKAAAIAEIFKHHERSSNAKVITIENSTSSDPTEENFWELLGGKEPITEAADAGDDLEAERDWNSDIKFFEGVSDGSGQIELVLQENYLPLKLDLLKSNSMFVLDVGNEVFAWAGKFSSDPDRKPFLDKAAEYLSNQQDAGSKPKWATLSKQQEGGETVLFRERFADWPDLSHDVSTARFGLGGQKKHDISREYRGRAKKTFFDVNDILFSELIRAEPRSDGTGQLQIWQIDNFNKIPIPESEYGQFFSGNCYLLSYSYARTFGGSLATKYLIMTWQGRDKTKKDSGSSALQASDLVMVTKRHGDTLLDTVRQGKEDDHFLSIFKERMIVHMGSRNNEPKQGLYHLQGNDEKTLHAVQILPSAYSLNSKDAFIVQTNDTQYIWFGTGFDRQLRGSAEKIAKILNNESITNHYVFDEGQESEDFWSELGGKVDYSSAEYLKTQGVIPKRVFAFNLENGYLAAKEIFEKFSQDDLIPTQMFLLDVFHELYLWLGKSTEEQLKKKALDITSQYCKLLQEKDERRPKGLTAYTVIDQSEPLNFTCHFHAWRMQLETIESEEDNDAIKSPPPPKLTVSIPEDHPEKTMIASASAPAHISILHESVSAPNSPHLRTDSGSESPAPGSPSINPLRVLDNRTRRLSMSLGRPLSLSAPTSPAVRLEESLQHYDKTYTFEVLKNNPPKELDKTKLEAYLEESEFSKVFGCSKADFYKLPKWKQLGRRKEVGLF
eukprot:TRINITY_DN3235_c0_g1_i2.p1 TRINITY_DN3235_c0_g1~~TRINITY_DN3235_c0_g1_i2.p1  ORF type:complete len:1475 (-),score=468.43 TRINITY_DN3235_c0_g1_i2:24-4448(-)